MDCHICHDKNDKYDNAILPYFGLLRWVDKRESVSLLPFEAAVCAAVNAVVNKTYIVICHQNNQKFFVFLLQLEDNSTKLK